MLPLLLSFFCNFIPTVSLSWSPKSPAHNKWFALKWSSIRSAPLQSAGLVSTVKEYWCDESFDRTIITHPRKMERICSSTDAPNWIFFHFTSFNGNNLLIIFQTNHTECLMLCSCGNGFRLKKRPLTRIGRLKRVFFTGPQFTSDGRNNANLSSGHHNAKQKSTSQRLPNWKHLNRQ